MDPETDFSEAFTDLRGILSASGTTLNVLGGFGGQGGRGGQDGGTGGKGEGPVINFARAERFTIQVNDGSASKNSRTPSSAIDSAPPQFSICDINLQREVYLTDSRFCFRRKRDVVRRYHTAKVKDQKEMTVVVYEGQDAKEELKRDVAKYMKFRHPSFVQLYGMVYSENIYASIFYDVLIPWRDIKSIYRQSPMVLCYLYAYVTNECVVWKRVSALLGGIFNEQQAASGYFRRRFGSGLYGSTSDYTVFLRPSTGRLCIDLGSCDYVFLSQFIETAAISPMSLLSTIDTATQIIIDALTIEQYHQIWHLYFGATTEAQFSLTTTVHLGALYHATGHHDLGNPVAIAPTQDIDDCLNRAWRLSSRIRAVDPKPHITDSGWNRFAVSELIPRPGEEINLYLWAKLGNSDLWLSQANHVLNRLGVFLNPDNYALLNEIWFKVEIDPQSATSTSLQVGPASFKCPGCVGYWSLDPLGVDRLSPEQAAELAFPTISISIRGRVRFWSDTAYAGLRQFHQGKGFNPNSQDLARHLGVPLYQLYCDYEKSLNVDGTEAHIEEPTSSDTDQAVDEEEAGNLGVVQDENCESVPNSGVPEDEDWEDMVPVSSPLKVLALIQLSLTLLIAVLDLYGSL